MVFDKLRRAHRNRSGRRDSSPLRPPSSSSRRSFKRPSTSGSNDGLLRRDTEGVDEAHAVPTVNEQAAPSTASASKPKTDPAAAALVHPGHIADESQLLPLSPNPPDLRALNNSLAALAVVFPDVQIEVFREMLSSFDGESRLALVANALIKNRVAWVKGRWRTAGSRGSADPDSPDSDSPDPDAPSAASVPPMDRFRSLEYQKAATALAYHEFRHLLSHSAIDAVMAEHNYAYLEARHALAEVASSTWSWRSVLSSILPWRKSANALPPAQTNMAKKAGSGSGSGSASATANAASASGDAPPPAAAPTLENDPLVVWKSSGRGYIVPMIRATGCAELDRELYAALIAPVKAQRRAAQEEQDRVLAVTMNMAEAEAAGATYECTCCFGTVTFEEMTLCSGDGGADGHVVCFDCVRHIVREAVFGQGWAPNIDVDRGVPRCPAATDGDACAGIVPCDQMRRALLGGEDDDDGDDNSNTKTQKEGADVLAHLERRLAEHSLVGSGLPLVRCPFCAYAEVDDIYVPFQEAPLRLRLDSLYSLAFLLVLFGATPVLLLPLLLLMAVAASLPMLVCFFSSVVSSCSSLFSASSASSSASARRSRGPHQPHSYWTQQLSAAVARYQRRRRGQQFRCQNPACGRVSCLGCSKAWVDVHVCHESALVALRTQMEQAMSMAIKRVCPRCHTAFVKTEGCNKLTCPCGYKMCYVCRRDISATDDGNPDAGYRHFCPHFRPEGDGRPCTECRKCNLWEAEDTEAVLAAARAQAERQWRASERRALSRTERAYLETGVATATASNAPPAAAVTASLWRVVGSVFAVGATGKKGRKDREGNSAEADDDESHVEGDGLRFRLPTVAEVLDWLLECLLI